MSRAHSSSSILSPPEEFRPISGCFVLQVEANESDLTVTRCDPFLFVTPVPKSAHSQFFLWKITYRITPLATMLSRQ